MELLFYNEHLEFLWYHNGSKVTKQVTEKVVICHCQPKTLAIEIKLYDFKMHCTNVL